MTTWADATDSTVTYSASIVEDGYTVGGYVVGGYISPDSAWTASSADTATWASGSASSVAWSSASANSATWVAA